MICRLSFSIPTHLLTTLANRLLMGKVLAAAPINIPTRLHSDDYCHGYVGVTEDINKPLLAQLQSQDYQTRSALKFFYRKLASNA